eukprot:CAMPEP_0185758644 /NCGR_PEP_ID=MMETSP1174-20130828/17336_1 /TAXON_ID=35687 /ORGANISM="Dictyocha speculum, Strain CCMP1381" /LENGTH=74 /DNA_ID=CAMNT_0028438603 /DNA_START=13 /DNA_END=237 /DNA_ORIENTATION=-
MGNSSNSPAQSPPEPEVQEHVKPEGDDIDDMVARNPCAVEYETLEECLGETDRNWTKCQTQVQALQDCAKANRK